MAPPPRTGGRSGPKDRGFSGSGSPGAAVAASGAGPGTAATAGFSAAGFGGSGSLGVCGTGGAATAEGIGRDGSGLGGSAWTRSAGRAGRSSSTGGSAKATEVSVIFSFERAVSPAASEYSSDPSEVSPFCELPARTRRRTAKATSSSIELECVFLSFTPSSVRRAIITPGFTSSSRASSFIRIFFIEETADNPLCYGTL